MNVLQERELEQAKTWFNIKKRFEVHNGKLVNTKTGEEVPGITVTEREDKIEIKVE